MLKTLRITSLIAVVLAVCGVVLILYLGLKKDPDITAYLDNTGAVGKFKDQVKDGDKKELDSPLVTQAHLFALRINPPPPPKKEEPVVVEKDDQPVKPDTGRTRPEKPIPPPPPPPPPAKFTLLATVMCESNPKRSMVLLRQAGNKDEWFWQGDKVGLMEVEEVRDGSAVFSQSGRNQQELFVPVKPEGKSLLKNDATASRGPTGPGSITTPLGAASESSETTAATAGQTETASATANRAGRIDRSRTTSASSAEARQEVSDRIRRIRTVPAPPTPAEQKESLQESISSIQQIMNRDDSSVSEEQRKQENETWMKLLEALQGEKAKIPEVETPEPAAKEDEPAKAQDTTSQADDEGRAETPTPPQDPNEE